MGESSARWGSWLAALATASCFSCASGNLRPQCPAAGGKAWVQVDSAHFRVISDFPTLEAAATARELERSYAALEAAIFVRPRAPSEITSVILFEDESDFHAFTTTLVTGVFYSELPGDIEPSRCILLHGGLTEESRQVLLHELTHDFVERNFGAAPPWLNEGLAEYYSTVAVEGGQIRVGRALPKLTFTDEPRSYGGKTPDGTPVTAISLGDLPSATALLRLDEATWRRITQVEAPDDDDRLRGAVIYVGAWALVHMLHDGPVAYQQRYARFLRAVQSSSVDDAFRTSFGDIPPLQFDRDFRAYVAARQVAVGSRPFVLPAGSSLSKVRLLSDGEVHLLWARLSSWRGAGQSAAKAELAEALRAAPNLPEAHYYSGLFALEHGDFATAERELTQSLQLSPNHPQFLLGMVALRQRQAPPSGPGQAPDPALAEAMQRLAAVANSATELRVVAEFDLEHGDRKRGFEFAKRAVLRAPLDPLALDRYAIALAEQGQLDDAIATERKAIAFLPDGRRAPGLDAHLQRLQAMQRDRQPQPQPPQP